MSETSKPESNLDDQLADYTDQLLDGGRRTPPTPPSKELRGLEETVLKLEQTVQAGAVDPKVLKRMQADFNSRLRNGGARPRPAWQSNQTRRRMVLVYALIVLLLISLFSLPFLTSGTGSIQATAGLNPDFA